MGNFTAEILHHNLWYYHRITEYVVLHGTQAQWRCQYFGMGGKTKKLLKLLDN